ncbi:N-glycosylase/DNA lyase [Methanolinea mesophila]|uniref:DNA-3-methyladenine glycosylase family protein n=1 Tax=Methanolinea mesophila TaxID=547055 RepID=UPI001AE2ACA9|nr:DNA glycosylase [Methanolinea mesophila]MBP1928452.1 N-glycosylase/DNA lyase [Methanolinea mesophila]
MDTLTLRPDQPFSLDHTLSCGQVFRWEKDGGWWYGIVDQNVIRVRQRGRKLSWQGADEAQIRHYFQLDLDLPAILTVIAHDPLVRDAVARCNGLRIVAQPPWECLASYICATYTNIPVIKKRIALFSARYGEEIPFRGKTYHAFPTPEALAEAGECDLRECRMGYRAPYLCDTAGIIAGDPGWEQRVSLLPYPDARKELLRLKGVGKKVADCVLLFAFQKYEAFPVDVWIRKILTARYPGAAGSGRDEDIAAFGRQTFGPYAGYAQEYLFCNRENIGIEEDNG